MSPQINEQNMRKSLLDMFFFLPLLVFALIFTLQQLYVVELALSFTPYMIALQMLYLIFLTIVYLRNQHEKEFIIMLMLNLLIAGSLLLPFASFYRQQVVIATTGDNELKIFAGNIYYLNQQPEHLQEYILEKTDYDLLVLLEYTPVQYRMFHSALEQVYPYQAGRVEDLPQAFAGKVIYSKYPLEEITDEDLVDDLQVFLGARVQLPGTTNPVRVFAVHTTAPASKEFFKMRNAQLARIDEFMESYNNRVIMVGDFNITPWSYYYQKFLTSENYENISGRNGMQFSWALRTFPLMKAQIDHTFITNEFKAGDYRLEDIPGSDHRAQLFTLYY